MLFAFMSFGKPPKIHGIRSKIPQYVIFSDFIGEKSKNGHKAVYVVSHFSGKRSKTIGIRTKTSGKSKNNHNDEIFSHFILKTPGIHFTGIRSKATEIMTKSAGIRSKATGIMIKRAGIRSKTTELKTESTAIHME